MQTLSNALKFSQALTEACLHLKTSVVFCTQDKDRNDISDEHCQNFLKNKTKIKINLTCAHGEQSLT